MEYLLDTHTLLWALYEPDKLPNNIKELIESKDNSIFYSSASLFEIELKHRKYPDKFPFEVKEIADACLDSDIENLPIFNKHIFQLNKLENIEHRDPFDLILISQAIRSSLVLLTHDYVFKNFDEKIVKLF